VTGAGAGGFDFNSGLIKVKNGNIRKPNILAKKLLTPSAIVLTIWVNDILLYIIISYNKIRTSYKT
jgi:hypothetical protein